MAKATVDITQEQKKAFKNYIKTKLQEYFENEINDYGETKAKLNLLNNKDIVIDNIINEIRHHIPLSFKNYWLNGSFSETQEIINDTYFKIYNETFKAYNLKQKAQKDYYKTLIYNEILFDIENSEETLQDTIFFVKTIDYKKALLKDLIKEQEDFNIDLFNELYEKTRNRVIREFKQQLEIEKAQENQNNSIEIPLGWKVCGLTEIVNKIFKI